MTTTLWLEDRAADQVLLWERLRLAGIGLVLLGAAASGAGMGLVVTGCLYIAANLWFLARLVPAVAAAHSVMPAQAGT